MIKKQRKAEVAIKQKLNTQEEEFREREKIKLR